MIMEEKKVCEHVLELQPGSEAEIELRFAVDDRTSFRVSLAAVDAGRGTAELVFDDMWDGYEMQQFVKQAGRWRPIWPSEDGDVHAVVSFGAGKHLNISSDTALLHSLDLIHVAWRGGSLRLTFRESA
jgi:hypothetical protein